MSDRRARESYSGFDKKVFLEELEDFGTILKFVCFFDNANFLVLPYRILNDRIHVVLEDTEGNTLQFENFRCGYFGDGPRNTVEALMALGIKKSVAESYCTDPEKRGIQLTLIKTEDGYEIDRMKSQTGYWFDTTGRDGLIDLRDVASTLVCRTLTFDNLVGEQFVSFAQCLHYMQPCTFEYSIDPQKPLMTEQQLEYEGFLNKPCTDTMQPKDANLLIEGHLFSIYACIPKENVVGTLNAVYFAITGQQLFSEEHINGLIFMSKASDYKVSFWTVLQRLLSTSKLPSHDIIPISPVKFSAINHLRPHTWGKA